MELGHPRSLTDDSEGVDVAVAEVGPVVEPDTEFESGLRGRHELALIDFHETVEALHGRDRGFTHTDGADQVGFDQRNFELSAQSLRETVRSQPARGAATGDD